MPPSPSGHLWEVRDTDDLVPLGKAGQSIADQGAGTPADSLVRLVQNNRPAFVGGTEDCGKSKQESRSLTAGGDRRERAPVLASVERRQELDLIHPLVAERAGQCLAGSRSFRPSRPHHFVVGKSNGETLRIIAAGEADGE